MPGWVSWVLMNLLSANPSWLKKCLQWPAHTLLLGHPEGPWDVLQGVWSWLWWCISCWMAQHPLRRGGKTDLCQLKGSAERGLWCLLWHHIGTTWGNPFFCIFLMSDLEPVRGPPIPEDHVQCLYKDHLQHHKDFTKKIFWIANSKILRLRESSPIFQNFNFL